MNSKCRLTTLFAMSTVMIAACSVEPEISFKSDIKPITDNYCLECHKASGEGVTASGFLTDSYESIMQGTKYGLVIGHGDTISISI